MLNIFFFFMPIKYEKGNFELIQNQGKYQRGEVYNYLMSQLICIFEDEGVNISTSHIGYFKILRALGRTLILCKISIRWRERQFKLKLDGRQYTCKFQRQLRENLSSLQQLIKNIDISESFELQSWWFAIYSVDSYPQQVRGTYHMHSPVYGEEIIVKNKQKRKFKIISNCFKQNGSYFYFVNDQDSFEDHQISQILDLGETKIYGLNVRIGKTNFCLPLTELILQRNTPLKIKIEIQQSLRRVVYLNHGSSHCTGILISPRLILTVRHLFSTTEPPIGTVVSIRLYPYNGLRTAKLIILPLKFIDLAVLQIVNELQQSKQTSYLQNDLSKLSKAPNLRLGMKIYAIGFGKYSYQKHQFDAAGLLLPTITYGVVSKTVTFKETHIYFKTDCYLYNGYSGCAIWHEGNWLGNSVFIIKNKVSLDKHPKHNFNYSRSFIQEVLLNKEVVNYSSYQQFFRTFQDIHTRKDLKIMAKL